MTDESLAAEIELLGEVIAGATTHSGPLSADQVDEVLGVHEPEPQSEPQSEPEY